MVEKTNLNQTESSADETPTKRPWYRVKRILGLACGGVAVVLFTIPGAPVLITLGTVAITTGTVATAASFLGTFVFGYGQGAKVEREKQVVK